MGNRFTFLYWALSSAWNLRYTSRIGNSRDCSPAK